jgi:hypothetical protein
MSYIARENSYALITILSGEAESETLDFGNYAGGMVLVPSAWTAANIGFKVSRLNNGTYNILRDDIGVPVQISTILTSGARWYTLPSELYGAKFVRLWSKSTVSATETDTNQGAERELELLLKG